MNEQMLARLLWGEWSWLRLGRSLLFIYVCFAIYIFFFVDRLIFPSPPSSYQDSKNILKFKSNGRNLSAVYSPLPTAGSTNVLPYTILYMHGNGEDLGDIQPVLERLNQLGFNVFAYDYSGYGTSEGKASERNAYEDADAAYNYLTKQLKIAPEKIILYGYSIGGGPAFHLAVNRPVAGLIVQGTFTTTFRVKVPIPILPFDRFVNIAKIKKINCPVLVMHGKEDKTIPFSHGEKLFAAAPTPKLSLWVDNAGHNDFLSIAGERYSQSLTEFVQLIEGDGN